jgi:hypothetical protein
VEYVPTLHFHQRHNKPMFWLTHMFLPWAHNPIARWVVDTLIFQIYRKASEVIWCLRKF